MNVVEKENFKIYVYPEDHPPPHCHVRFKDGTEISIDLPLIVATYNDVIPKEVYEAVRKNLNKLSSEWERLNPIKASHTKKTKGK